MMNHGGVQRLTRRLFTTSRQVVSPNTENLSFSVLRTSNGQFPVYKVYKNNGKIVNTVVKHVRGDLNECRKALANICESPVKIHMGSLEVRGIHTWKVKEFLESVGL